MRQCEICGEGFNPPFKQKRVCSEECRRVRTRRYVLRYEENNKEKVNARRRNRRQKSPENFREQGKRYREKNKDKISERQRLYQESNPEKNRDRNRAYSERNREELAQKARKQYHVNRAKAAELDRILAMSPEELISFAIQRGVSDETAV
jgi:hypothetical protein